MIRTRRSGQIEASRVEVIVKNQPAFTKSPPDVLERFAAATDGLSSLEHRKMFGYPSVFVNGNMLAGVFQDRVMVRLSEADRAKFLAMPNARVFEPMPGRPMREYVEIGAASMPAREMRRWIERGLVYVEGLPTKAKKAKPKRESKKR